MSVDDAVLLLSVLFAMLLVWRWHNDKTNFDITRLITTDDGTVSLGKVGQLVALVISTWAIVHETRAGKLTEWLFGGYMIAWAAANLVSKGQDLKAIADKAKEPLLQHEDIKPEVKP